MTTVEMRERLDSALTKLWNIHERMCKHDHNTRSTLAETTYELEAVYNDLCNNGVHTDTQ